MPKEERNGTITQYNVTVTTKSSGEVLQNKSVQAESGGDVTQGTLINNLEMYVTYVFKVQAFTKEGAGPFSEPPVNGTTVQTGKENQKFQTPIRRFTMSVFVGRKDEEHLVIPRLECFGFVIA